MHLRIGYFILCLFISVLLEAQEQDISPEQEYLREDIREHDFDQNDWKNAIEGIDYSGSKPVKKKEKESEARSNGQGREQQQRRSRPLISLGEGSGAGILKFFLIVTAIIIIVILLKNLLGLQAGPRNKKIKGVQSSGAINLEKIEENIYESDLIKYIRQALDKEDYPLAIRLYYLAILKELSLAKVVKWKRDKTNRDYVRELQQSAFLQPFRDATRIFEQTWYGSATIDKNEFSALEPKFKGLLNRIVSGA